MIIADIIFSCPSSSRPTLLTDWLYWIQSLPALHTKPKPCKTDGDDAHEVWLGGRNCDGHGGWHGGHGNEEFSSEQNNPQDPVDDNFHLPVDLEKLMGVMHTEVDKVPGKVGPLISIKC